MCYGIKGVKDGSSMGSEAQVKGRGIQKTRIEAEAVDLSGTDARLLTLASSNKGSKDGVGFSGCKRSPVSPRHQQRPNPATYISRPCEVATAKLFTSISLNLAPTTSRLVGQITIRLSLGGSLRSACGTTHGAQSQVLPNP